jgi:hypothetical protein
MSDNVVLTQVKQVRRAAKVTSRVGQPKDDAVLPKFPPREVTMYHKIVYNAQLDPIGLLTRKLDTFAAQITFLEAAGLHKEVRKYKRLQFEASTEVCDEKLSYQLFAYLLLQNQILSLTY